MHGQDCAMPPCRGIHDLTKLGYADGAGDEIEFTETKLVRNLLCDDKLGEPAWRE